MQRGWGCDEIQQKFQNLTHINQFSYYKQIVSLTTNFSDKKLLTTT